MQVQPPLNGDNDSADNVAKDGSTVPVKVKIFACGADVTSSGSVTVKIGVAYVPNGGAPGQNPVPTFNGAGDSGGVMVFDGQFYHYNLDTKGYFGDRGRKLPHSISSTSRPRTSLPLASSWGRTRFSSTTK